MSCTSCANCHRKFDDSEGNIKLYALGGRNDCVCQGCNQEYRQVNKTAVFLDTVRAKRGFALGPAAIPRLQPYP